MTMRNRFIPIAVPCTCCAALVASTSVVFIVPHQSRVRGGHRPRLRGSPQGYGCRPTADVGITPRMRGTA